MPYIRTTKNTTFAPLPDSAQTSLSWPTDNESLFTDPDSYFAKTRVNPDYGRPGWTRDCGKYFHCGCDIAPVNKKPDGKTHTVMFSNCETGEEYPSDEPGWIPNDKIYAVQKGVVVEISNTADTIFGRYVIIEHRWGDWGNSFFSLYAHLDEIRVDEGDVVKAGATIATMGMTSGVENAHAWMAISPHLHIEFWNDAGENFNPEEFLIAFVGRK